MVQRWCQEEANGILCINGRMKIRGKVDVFGFRCAGNSPRPMFSRGDVLMYRLNTWHRGTPVHPGHVRYTHNLLFKRADNKDIQIWNRGFTQKMYSDHLERFIGTLEPDQLETMGFPTRDSPKWLSTKFCEAIRQRYGWTGFDVRSYVKTDDTPPQVPEFWTFSNFTLIGASGTGLRAELFAKLSAENVHISLRSSDWRYCLECVPGVHYLEIDCCFFQRDSDAIVDINLISGDRWAWGRLLKRLKPDDVMSPFVVGGHVQTTPAYIKKELASGKHSEENIFLMGDDLPEESFLPFLHSRDLNIVRIASSRLTRVHDEPLIRFWRDRNPRNFLEHEISKNICALAT